jgi:hypothetical protein
VIAAALLVTFLGFTVGLAAVIVALAEQAGIPVRRYTA